jgi:hypothetical protein
VRRLRGKTDAPVSTLPFLFEAEVGLSGYRKLASEL